MPSIDLPTTLRSRGQRVTPQRLVIHDALVELDRHVTADEVHAAVSERLPNVSAPTVYATLELFEELGIVRRINLAAGAALYDPRPDDHHHLVCVRCGRVEDVDAGVDMTGALRAASRRGFRADHAEVVVYGLCSDCA
jgi:Fur family transcriptional regulator, stress-responsive regulator